MNYRALLNAIQSAHQEMKGRAVTAVNQALVLRNWLIGRFIVEFQQNGSDRAKYGMQLLERLSQDLTAQRLRGFSLSSLERLRSLYLIYPQLKDSISSSPIMKFRLTLPSEHLSNSVITNDGIQTVQSKITPLASEMLLRFSWTHFQELVRIDNPVKRAFYENECLKGNWSVRQLQRQIESLLYERTGLSTNKKAVIARGRLQEKSNPAETMEEMIRDPYVLEFTGLSERSEYSESDLETVLLDHLQRFLLELGTGFCFEARQFRMTMNNKHNHVDLVFYNRRLRCHLLIDLKVRAFRHADAGQMNFYLNWFKTNMMAEGDSQPVGIILCSNKDGTEVEFATAGMDNKLFVSRYLTFLPSAQQLKTLIEGDRAYFMNTQ